MTNAQQRAPNDRVAPPPSAEECGAPSGVAPARPSVERAEPRWQSPDVATTAPVDDELDCAPMMIIRLDADGRVNHVNEAWRQFVRQSGAPRPIDDGLRQSYLELVHTVSEPAAKAVVRVLQQLPPDAGAAVRDEYRCDVERALRWFRVEARRLADGVLVMHTDISEQRRAEAHLLIQSLVSTALAGRQPIVSACRRIIRVTSESLGWDFAAVWVPNDWQKLVCADAWTNPRLAGSEFENLSRTTTFERGKGLPGRVWETQRPHWVHDIAAADSFPRLQRGRAIGLQSGFAVPLQCDGHVFAVLEFFVTVARPEDSELIELLSVAGFQLGADELRARALVRAEAAEAGALLTRTRFEAISEAAPGYILWIDREFRIQFINRVMPHHRRDEVIGSNCLSILPPAEHPAMQAKLQAVFDSGSPQRHEISVPGPDGREIWLSIQMNPMREKGEVVGIVITSLDSTELKRTQMEFASAQRWVSVGTLAAGIAHEINTPIQFVNDNLSFIGNATKRLLALAQTLAPLAPRISDMASDAELREASADAAKAVKAARLPFLEAEVPKAIDACIEGLARVSTIVQSLKEFASAPSEQMELADLNHIVERSLAIAVNEYRYVADLETRFAELPPVRCQSSEIGQVVLNLVINAAHAIADVAGDTDEKGLLHVSTRREGDQAIIAIRDTGTGIPEAIRPRIFDPFFT
ncbi:MAG TPA: PAS domain-containing protein, partial [Polyangiaceae bacterium]|nr:PAS domain-containing protein [Polyangiaceae bacterium]